MPMTVGESLSRSRLLFLMALMMVAGVVCAGTFAIPYAFDDLDVLQRIADYRTGLLDWRAMLMRPHNEHAIPFIAFSFLLSTSVAGLASWPLHTAIVVIHAVGAWATGRTALSLTERPAAMWIAGCLYAAAGGFVGSALWLSAGSAFAMGAALLSVSTYLSRAQGWRALSGSVATLVGGIAAMAGTAFAGASLVFEGLAGRNRSARWLVYASVIGGALVLLRVNAAIFGVHPRLDFSLAGVAMGGTLFGIAPWEFVATWLPGIGPLPLAWRLALGAAVWLLMAAWLRRMDVGSRRLLIACYAAQVCFCLVVGLGRSDDFTLAEAARTDRYHVFFLMPFSLHAGIACAMLLEGRRRMLWRALFVAATPVALLGSYQALNRSVFWDHVNAQAAAAAHWRRLAELVTNEAERLAPDPLTLSNGMVPIAHYHRPLRLSTLILSARPELTGRVRFVSEEVGPLHEQRQNAILSTWLKELGPQAPPLVVRAGRMGLEPPGSLLDFTRGPRADAIKSGFHAWSQPGYHWMGKRGVVNVAAGEGDVVLRAYAPLDALRRKWPGLPGVRVTVSLNRERIGEVVVDQSAPTTWTIPRPPGLVFTAGQVELVLEADRTWRPLEVLPGNFDERELSIAVIEVGLAAASKVQ